ncbi:hypothetical protein [Microbacterium sp.]|uniref:hypothetical protein n=1 Tax=Microbacterium sp. TaxID=51671 RepID=UPI002811664F|nr:hypothetical protein [Microbacterium sp.]
MTPEMWWTTFGWLGSALVVFSLVQTNIVGLRIFNLIGCVLAVIYNTPLAIWPSVGLNGAIVIINAVHLVKLRRQRVLAESERAPRVSTSTQGSRISPCTDRGVLTVEAAPSDVLVGSLLAQRRDEVERRGGAPLYCLLAEATAVRFAFDGDILQECTLLLPAGERSVYGASRLKTR